MEYVNVKLDIMRDQMTPAKNVVKDVAFVKQLMVTFVVINVPSIMKRKKMMVLAHVPQTPFWSKLQVPCSVNLAQINVKLAKISLISVLNVILHLNLKQPQENVLVLMECIYQLMENAWIV